jgi:hypothetical protein
MKTSFDSQRIAVELLNHEFGALMETLNALTRSVPADVLYKRPPTTTVGENILRSAGAIEQTFGGITANLWDDPFEWTLPETLPTSAHILHYLAEVENTRSRAFVSFADDLVLLKKISLPSGEQSSLISLLLQTLVRAADYRGRAIATFKMFSEVSATGFII